MTDNILEIKPRKGLSKQDRFKNEQEEIVNKLNAILGFDSKNNKFILEELKNDIEKQKKILELVSDVEKYFACAKWSCFNKKVDNKWFSLMRSIYKSTNYEIQYKHKMKDGSKYTEYTIIKNL